MVDTSNLLINPRCSNGYELQQSEKVKTLEPPVFYRRMILNLKGEVPIMTPTDDKMHKKEDPLRQRQNSSTVKEKLYIKNFLYKT